MHEASSTVSELLLDFRIEVGSVEIRPKNIDVTTLPIDCFEGSYHCVAGYVEKFVVCTNYVLTKVIMPHRTSLANRTKGLPMQY